MIQLKNINKSFNSKPVLRNLNLDLKEGSVNVILGSSGCGKSTLLRILSGLELKDEGEFFYKNLSIDSIPVTDFGYVIQEGGLFPHLKAQENICLAAKMAGWDQNKLKKRLDELLELVSLDSDLVKKYPHQLSGGQRQRLALARALFMDPPVLLLDEPLGALDSVIRFDLQKELKNLFKKLNKTVVLITHDLREAAFLGDTIHLLHSGQVEQSGSFRELMNNPKSGFVKEFTSSFSMEGF